MLDTIFHELNRLHFSSELPLPKLNWNSRLSSTAGRFCTGSRNPLFPRPPQIEVATYLRDIPDGQMHVRDTVLHEMIHYFLWHRRRPHGHTPEFHRIMNKVGAKRYNPVPKERAFKHYYACPNCKKGFPTRRRLTASACMGCCQRFNHGRYSEKFRLERTAPPAKEIPLEAAPPPIVETPALPPAEVIRRLEELKLMLSRPRAMAK